MLILRLVTRSTMKQHSQSRKMDLTSLTYVRNTRVVPKVMSKYFACELGTADEGECGGRWNQLLCYP